MKIIWLNTLIFWLGIAGIGEGAGQTERPTIPKTFDLVLFGEGWEAETVEVSLMENPGAKKNWIIISKEEQYETRYLHTKEATLMVIRDIDARRFVGQDIRENYVALRLKTSDVLNSDQVYFRSVWVVEHERELNAETLNKWMEYIRQNPLKMKEHSVASLSYPRSKRLEPGQSYIDHIELPVRHLKAGVQEVRWLDILFAP